MAIFDEKIEIRERCKGVHCVDLGESFPTRIYLQKSASIQPRTSPPKFQVSFPPRKLSFIDASHPRRGRGAGAPRLRTGGGQQREWILRSEVNNFEK